MHSLLRFGALALVLVVASACSVSQGQPAPAGGCCAFAAQEAAGPAETPAAPIAAPEAPPAALPLATILDNMELARKKLQTYEAVVAKQRRIVVLDETEEFTGSLQFKMPRLLRLELKEKGTGVETLYILGEKYGWIVRPLKNQAERATLTALDPKVEVKNPLEYGLARPIHELQKVYAINLLPPEKVNNAWTWPLELTPRKKEYAAGKLVFWIDPKTWLPSQLREFKSNDEIIETHTFASPVVNGKIKDKVFDYDPPRKMDVIIHD